MPLVSTCVIHGTPTSESQQDRVTGRLQHSPFLGLLLLRVFSSRSESKSFCVLSLSFFLSKQGGWCVCTASIPVRFSVSPLSVITDGFLVESFLTLSLWLYFQVPSAG